MVVTGTNPLEIPLIPAGPCLFGASWLMSSPSTAWWMAEERSGSRSLSPVAWFTSQVLPFFFRLCIETKDAGAAPDVAAEVLGRDEAESVAAKPGANLIRGSRHCCRMASLSQHAGDNQCSYGLPDAS